ncbi:C39 family peptidase [Pullulanibacillus sp. KACC 23026]|uniref:C39 family peptidase n=1 Tax=Pullulanibacillus sp. KACC 23026 TaxID=3028315 RepID=UPI0023B1F830|nr:C39 family peptidase [Pullulanibacillus sp. KACC 23026]WEG13211.1 C39 family peptidase [Pullulanibacillus sp. KACC 23026]
MVQRKKKWSMMLGRFMGLILFLSISTGCGTVKASAPVKTPSDSTSAIHQAAAKVKTVATSGKLATVDEKIKQVDNVATDAQLLKQKWLEWEKKNTPFYTFYDINTINKNIVVTASTASIRKEPSVATDIVKQVHQGAVFHAIGEATVRDTVWDEIKLTDKTVGWIRVSLTAVTSVEPEGTTVLLDAPIISQMPELQRGCEVTSLAMLLGQAGIKVSKMTLAKQIKKVPFTQNGLRGNPNDGFVGDIYTFKNPGLGVYHGPVLQLAKNYLSDAVDLTGSNWSAIEKKLVEGHAVWIITNSSFGPLAKSGSNLWYTWQTKDGPLSITYKEHSVLVTGFDKDSVYINDPLSGKKNEEIRKDSFVAAWKQMGSQAISY